MGSGSRGFTVIEAVVSLGVTALFLLLAAELLRDTTLISAAARRQALDPMPQHVAQQLRHDVHRARSTVRLRGSASELWSRGPLTLALPGGGTVRYERSANRVVRSLFDAGGAPRGERTLLTGAVSWRWLQLSADLVEVEIGFGRRPDGEALRRSARVHRSEIEMLRMRLAMRAVPGRGSW